jgi:cytochrome c2
MNKTPSQLDWFRWHLLGVLIVLIAPSLIWLREPFWMHPLDLSSQIPVWALAFVVASTAVQLVPPSTIGRIAVAVLALGLSSVLAYSLRIFRPSVPYARTIGAIALAISIGLILLSELLSGRVRTLATSLLATCAVLMLAKAGIDGWRGFVTQTTTNKEFLPSAYYPLEIAYNDHVIDKGDIQQGGGIAKAGNRFIIVTGSGAFYALTPQGASIASERMPLSSPANAAQFKAAMATSVNFKRFRVHDVAVRQVPAGWELFASHHRWEERDRCLYIALSKATVDTAMKKVIAEWKPLFQSHPCFPPVWDGQFSGDEAGGQLAWLNDARLLFTLGDHGFNGWNRLPAAAQQKDYDYGKVWLVDADSGHAEVFTTGHRNPQGVYVDKNQQIWSTEHGPQGGDELNLLIAGGNYSWPYDTYGTEYFRYSWPLNGSTATPANARPPVYAWLPSIGPSNLIGIEGTRFSRWKGNLLVASLRQQTLYRVVLDQQHVVYVEPLRIGRRIRDLIEGPEGDIWLWSDEGELVTLSVKQQSPGEAVFAGCESCHSLRSGAASIAPSLEGVVGRNVASRSDFPYSPALKALGGKWTEERLDAFLANPEVFVPGTQMSVGVSDAGDRAAVIAFLKERH